MAEQRAPEDDPELGHYSGNPHPVSPSPGELEGLLDQIDSHPDSKYIEIYEIARGGYKMQSHRGDFQPEGGFVITHQGIGPTRVSAAQALLVALHSEEARPAGPITVDNFPADPGAHLDNRREHRQRLRSRLQSQQAVLEERLWQLDDADVAETGEDG